MIVQLKILMAQLGDYSGGVTSSKSIWFFLGLALDGGYSYITSTEVGTTTSPTKKFFMETI